MLNSSDFNLGAVKFKRWEGRVALQPHQHESWIRNPSVGGAPDSKGSGQDGRVVLDAVWRVLSGFSRTSQRGGRLRFLVVAAMGLCCGRFNAVHHDARPSRRCLPSQTMKNRKGQ